MDHSINYDLVRTLPADSNRRGVTNMIDDCIGHVLVQRRLLFVR